MISPLEIVHLLWRRKGVLLALFLAGFSVGTVVYIFSPRAFEAEALIMIKKPNNSPVRVGGTEPAIVHTRILASTEVIRAALADVPLDPDGDRAPSAYVNRALTFVRSWMGRPSPSSQNEALLTAMRNLRTSVEPGGEVIRVGFRFGDPMIAADFVNAVTNHYASRLQMLSQWRDSDPIAKREDELVHAYKEAYDDLTEFSARTKLYSSDEQQRLALKRRNDLSAALAETRSGIEDKTAQLATYPEQLSKMKPLARVLGSTDLAGEIPADKRHTAVNDDDATVDTPPLLLQRVYQDTIQTVVKLRTELAGLEKKLDQLHREQDDVDAELRGLSQKEAEYNKLEFQVTQTRADAEAYTKWVTDQRSLSALPEIQVLQSASPPLRPIFPRAELIIPFCSLLSLLLGSVILIAAHIAGALGRHAYSTRPDFSAADYPVPAPRSWHTSVAKLETTQPLKQLGSGSA